MWLDSANEMFCILFGIPYNVKSFVRNRKLALNWKFLKSWRILIFSHTLNLPEDFIIIESNARTEFRAFLVHEGNYRYTHMHNFTVSAFFLSGSPSYLWKFLITMCSLFLVLYTVPFCTHTPKYTYLICYWWVPGKCAVCAAHVFSWWASARISVGHLLRNGAVGF